MGLAFLFCPLRLFPVFDRSASFDQPRFSCFPIKIYKEGNYTYIQYSQRFVIFFSMSRLSLTMSCHFQAPHVIMLRY